MTAVLGTALTSNINQGSKHVTQKEIADRIEEITGVKPNLSKSVLKALAQVAQEEVAAGNDFTIPGVARIIWRFRKPMKKGERWSKGDLVQGFGGSEEIKETDSPPVTAKARLIASPTGVVGSLKPKTDPVLHKEFLKSKTGKAIVRRLG